MIHGTTPFPAPRRRRFFLMLVPILALSGYDFWSNVHAGLRPGYDWLLLALGAPPVRVLGMAGLLLTYFLPLYVLLAWMRQGLSVRSLRDGGNLWGYIFVILALSQGGTMMAFVLVHQISKLFVRHWMDDIPHVVQIAVTAVSVAFGVFWYRLLLNMEVMTTPFLRKGKHHGA